MFKRQAHRNVLALLQALDAGILSRCGFLFGGGTRIVLQLDEYRESQDVDFLCSDPAGYSDLRYQAATQGYKGLFQNPAELDFPREMRIDQYGIRFPVRMGEASLKVELIREARIALDPGVRPEWSPVDCLSLSDCYAEKLLANSDRWGDRQILARDLIDMSALRARTGPIPETAWRKAEAAYRSAARTDLEKALTALLGDTGYQQRCFQGMGIEDPGRLLEGMRLLRDDLSRDLHRAP